MARWVHVVFRLLAGLSALLVAALALLAARLAAGPISLVPVMPVIEKTLATASAHSVRIGGGDLSWQDWRRGLRVHLSEVSLGGEYDTAHGRIETIAIAFSAAALAQGVVAPSSIEASHAALSVKGGLASLWRASPARRGDAEDGAVANLLSPLRWPPDPRRPLSYLLRAQLEDIVVAVENGETDRGWRLRVGNARFSRDATTALRGQASLVLSRDGEDAEIAIDLASAAADAAVDGKVMFSGLRPAAYAGLLPELAPMAAIDAPLQGSVSLGWASGEKPAKIDAVLSGGRGALILNKPVTEAIGLAAPEQRLSLRSLALQVSLVPALGEVTVRDAELVFDPGTLLYVPAPVNHGFPLTVLSGHGSLINGRLSVPKLEVDLDGLRLTASAAVDNVFLAPSGDASLLARNVKVDDFRRYWPPRAAPGAYIWCIRHLRDGIVPRVNARIAFATRGGRTEVTSVDADFGVERLTVDYLPPMPPAHNVSGAIRIDLKTMRINVTGGRSGDVAVTGGTVSIPDLDHKVPSIDIDVAVAAPVRGAMHLIASEPLTYPQKIGIAPAQTSGDLTARLRLGFPLLAALKVDEMDVRAAVDLYNAGISDPAKRIGVSNANLHLDIDTKGMHAAGRLDVADVNGRLDLTYAFVHDVEPRTRLEFVADDVKLGRLRRSFPEITALDGYLLDGSLAARVQVAVGADGNGIIDGQIDLADAGLAVPYLGWRKEIRQPGKLDATLRAQDGRLTAVPRLAFVAPDMEARGSLRFGADGSLDRLDLDRLQSGRNDASATIARLADGRWDVMVGGNSVDLGPLVNTGENGARQSGASSRSWPDFVFAADLHSVWLSGPTPIRDVTATLARDDSRWMLVHAKGKLLDGSSIELAIDPAAGGARAFRAMAENAGEALRAFQIFPDMIGGEMKTEGGFDDNDPARPLTAKLRVKRYQVVNTPILARLLGLLSLSGIRNALAGKGIPFSTLDMPFRARKGVISIDNGRAFGSALGLTFSGDVDTETETLNIQGQVVPFYAVNSAIGHIPLVGDIMTGGEEGGGVFSAAYSVVGPLDDPQISVNSVSVLLPGFLRWVLETFEGWVTPEADEAVQ